MSRTRSFRDAVALYFRTRPNVWIDAVSLEFVGGRQAWRSRVSDCRTDLGMTIENRLRKVGEITISEYRYLPVPDAPAVTPHDLNQPWSLR